MKKILIIFFIFLYSCTNEYLNFHAEKNYFNESLLNIENELNNFSYDKIEYLSGVELKETPNLVLLDEIVEKINQATNRVYLEVYIFTEKRIRKAIKNANNRGVDVKIILEKNVYLAPYLNNQAYKILKDNKIDVVWTNSDNYSLNHTKMLIIDDEVIISTGNYSYSSFKFNREFFVFINNKILLDYFLEIFNNDYIGKIKNIYHPNLVLSPFYSRYKLEYLLKNAEKSIKIYSHNFSDKSLKEILILKQQEGIDIKIIFPDFKKVSSNEIIYNDFLNNNINIVTIKKPEIHAKTILIDDKYLYIGSINFSMYSLDKNREIGILIKNDEIIKEFLSIFNNDYNLLD